MRQLGQLRHIDRLVVMRSDSGGGAADLRQAAIGARELAQLFALRALQQAAEIIVRLATLEPGGPTGGYFDENGPLP